MPDLKRLVLRYFAATDGDPAEVESRDIDSLYHAMVDAAEGGKDEVAEAVRAYDCAIFLAASRGRRMISDSPALNHLANVCLAAAGGEPRFTGGTP